MSGNMHWFRWHHGTFSDPKFRLIAKISGQPVAVVIAVWAAILESASASEMRGEASTFDTESVAIALDIDVTPCDAIVAAMQNKMLDGMKVIAWDKRQPKREREDSSAERTREYRKNKALSDAENHVTPCDATKRHVTPREEKRREDKNREDKVSIPPISPIQAAPSSLTDFDYFWNSYPRRIGRGAALKAFKAATKKTQASELVAAASAYADRAAGMDPKYIPHPATWLNQERWLDQPDPLSRRDATMKTLEAMSNEPANQDF